MLISVIVPVYNVEKYLKKCLDSLIHQTWKELEIILVDDGSTDLSWNIIENLKVQHPQIHGIKFSRNYGKFEKILSSNERLRIQYEHSQVLDRNGSLIEQIMKELELEEEQLDEMWEYAQGL